MLCRSFINLSENLIEATKNTQELFREDVYKLFGELMVVPSSEIVSTKFGHRSPSCVDSSDSFHHLSHFGIAAIIQSKKRNAVVFQRVRINYWLKYLSLNTAKKSKRLSPFCLHHIVPIFWESQKMNDLMHQLINNKLVNNRCNGK